MSGTRTLIFADRFHSVTLVYIDTKDDQTHSLNSRLDDHHDTSIYIRNIITWLFRVCGIKNITHAILRFIFFLDPV